ncbi:MAG TPA: MFS transporter [Edaphocola sp.]|nr:MFS transporter [Edaphocola sp.]
MSLISKFFKKNEVLLNPEFRNYFIIRFGIIFALSLQFTIISYWIYQITGYSKMALAFVGLAEVVPVIGCSFFSGYFVDLSEKRNMMVKIIIAYCFLALGLFYLSTSFALGHLGHDTRIGLIYTVIFLGGTIRSFVGPTAFSLIGLLVPKRLYPNAVSWSSMAWQLGAVAGPIISGVIITKYGAETGMGIVVLLELLLLIPTLRIGKKPILKKEKEPILKSVSEGLKFVFKTPVLLGAQLLDMFAVLFGGAIALLPAVVQERFPLDTTNYFSGPVAFGYLRSAMGIGALLTLIILAILPLSKNPGKKLFLCTTGFALGIICFGLSHHFWLSMGLLVLTGMFDAVSVVVRGTILQLVTPDEMRGRVASVNSMFISSSNELGDFESGVMASWLGTFPAIVTGGCITLIVVAITFIKTPQLKNFSFKDYQH